MIVVVHGGSGAMSPERLASAVATQARDGLRRALDAGVSAATALDAVVAAVAVLEDDEVFNAGRGSALTAAGTIEHDAAVMDGDTGGAGAVACVCGPRHPVEAARLVMEATAHVLLVGEGAEAVARTGNLAFEAPEWFVTQRRRDELAAAAGGPTAAFGTVGAVALDRAGRLAAATSTGGMTGKAVGRVGDSPLIGAGTWADAVVAVSATGHGESFVRRVFAHEVSARMRLAGDGLEAACVGALEGLSGGCIAVSAAGEVAMPFATSGMYRGWIDGRATGDGVPRVAIFEGEAPA